MFKFNYINIKACFLQKHAFDNLYVGTTPYRDSNRQHTPYFLSYFSLQEIHSRLKKSISITLPPDKILILGNTETNLPLYFLTNIGSRGLTVP